MRRSFEVSKCRLVGSQLWPRTLPLDLAYTLTDAQISETNGNFNNGDHLASKPEQTLSLRAGLIFESGWESYVDQYIDERV